LTAFNKETRLNLLFLKNFLVKTESHEFLKQKEIKTKKIARKKNACVTVALAIVIQTSDTSGTFPQKRRNGATDNWRNRRKQ